MPGATMANTENVTVNLTLKRQGMDEAEKQSKQIKDNLEGAQKAFQGSASSRKFASSPSAQPTGSAGATAGIVAGREVEEYNKARGASVAAGGTARDFADQARGLGGLVRLYATAAANIYALTAAFGALSRAMDTTNMVKGLDQLGAASGVALGSLSKRLADATDGAISLREAMEATTKAVSSGMNSDDVLRLGTVAKQASQALGVDMGDAISRLTRGITKLEPELLDELGIFTKLDPAVKEYAKSVNKSVSELTDFERRAAFANAVLAEGEQKFSSIKLDVNPYTQLSASIRDATQNILEFVNKVVAPVASFFSQSPTALITGIAAIAGILVKQALPAIGEFKQGLEQTAQRAQTLAQQKAQDAVQARKLIDAQIIAEVEARADKELKAVEAAETKIQQLQKSGLDKRSAAYKLLKKDLQDIDEKDLQRVTKLSNEMQSKGRTAEAAAYTEVVTAIRAQQKAEEDLVVTKERLTAQVEKDAKSFGVYGLTIKAGTKAQEAATRSAIISNAAYNGSLIGVINSLRLLRAEIAANNITGLSAAMLTARGAIAAIGGAISTAMGALNGLFIVIGLITAAVSIFDGTFSKASKQLGEFDSSVDRTKNAVKNLSNTYDAIRETNPFNVKSLEAQSNALTEFSTGMDVLAKNAQKALRALEDSRWDSFKNRIKGIFNFDVRSTFAETFSESIVEGIEAIDNREISEKLKSTLTGILNVKDITNLEQVSEALKDFGPASAKVEQVKRALKAASIEAGVAASRAREFVSAFDASKDAFRDLSKQFEINDSTVKWANSSIEALNKLNANLQGPISDSIDNLLKASEELTKAPIFGSSSIQVTGLNKELREARDLIVNSEKAAQNLEQSLKDLQKAAAKDLMVTAEKLDSSVYEFGSKGRLTGEEIVGEEIRRLKQEIDKARKTRTEAEALAERLALKIKSSINEGLIESINLVTTGIQAALSKGSSDLLQSLYSRIDDIPELSGRQFELKVQELESQATLIRVQQDLANKIVLLTAETALNTAVQSGKKAREAVASATNLRQKEAANQDLVASDAQISTATEKLRLLRQAITDPVGTLKELSQGLKNSGDTAAGFAEKITEAKTVLSATTEAAGKAREAVSSATNLRQAETANQNLIVSEQALAVAKEKLNNLLKDQAASLKTSSQGIRASGIDYAKLSTEVLTTAQANAGFQVSLTGIRREQEALLKVQKPLAQEAARTKEKQDGLNIQLKALNVAKTEAQLQLSNLQNYPVLNAQALQEVASKIRSNKLSETNIALEDKKLKIQTEYNNKMIIANAMESQGDKQGAETVRRRADITKYLAVENAEREAINANAKIEADFNKEKLSIFDRQQSKLKEVSNATKDFNDKQQKSADDLSKAITDNSLQELNYLKDNNRVSAEFAAKRLAELELENQSVLNKSQIRQATLERDAALEVALAKKARAEILAGENADDAGAADYAVETARANELFQARIKAIAAANALSTRSVELAKEQSLETAKTNKQLEKQNNLLNLFNSAADTLSSGFGTVGEKLGSFVRGLGESVAKQSEFNTAREKLLKIESDYQAKVASGKQITPEDTEQRTKAEKDLAKLMQKNAKDEMLNNIKLVGSVKNMFKEKTVAYRLFNAFERAMHVYSLTMDAAKIASGWMVTQQQVAQDQIKAASAAAPAGANAAKDTPGDVFTKIAAGLAAFAFVMSLAKGGGGVAPGISSADRQETQGTGLSWVDGKKVENGLGVFGDPEAKNDAIRKSLKTIEENSVDGLSYDNKVVEILKSIDNGINGAAKSLYGIKALRPQSITTDSSGGNILSNLVSSIFGKTSKTIVDSGIKLEGSFRQLAGDVDGALTSIYTTIQTKSSALFGLISSTKVKTSYDTTSEDVQNLNILIEDIFSNVLTLFDEIGTTAGLTKQEIRSTLDSLGDVGDEISTKGLTGQALVDEVNAVISTIIQKGSLSLFKFYEQFQEFGEDLTQTVLRIQDQTVKANQQLKNLGIVSIQEAIPQGTLTNKQYSEVVTLATNSLVKLSGGLEQFVEKSEYFRENFLTEAERLAPVQKAVTDELNRLELSYVDTIDEFKAVVQSLDLTTESGQQLYAALMNLAPGFVRVYEEVSKSLTVEEMRVKVLNQEMTILKLLGKSEQALAMQRAEELSELAKYPKEQADILIANQKYIYALEDEQKAKDLLIKQQDKLKTTVNSLKTALDTLNNYKNTLLGGDLSTLTPFGKYQQSQSEFERLQSIALGPASTEAEIAAQNDAISKLPQAADKFLQLSRTLFASGSQYTTDFNKVVDAVDASQVILSAQKTDAEIQIEQLQLASNSLNIIEQNSYTTNEILERVANAVSATTTAAQEVSVSEPVQVIVKEAADRAIVQQLEQTNARLNELRTELEQLRADQQAQTGAIIASNAQVVNASAQIISAAVNQTQNVQSWYDRQVYNLP